MPSPSASAALRWPGVFLVSASWLSAALFGAYILAFYVGAVPSGRLDRWNDNLPRLYDGVHPLAIVAIGAHFVTGAVLLLLGPVQLLGQVRRRFPALHRWTGRVYVVTAGITGLGGLGYILSQGTIGGRPMSLGFGLYGALVFVAAIETYRHGRARRLAVHRAWAIRLFALTIGSWLYRMEYGFWLLAAAGAGHTDGFDGPFDVVMAFFFYLPNLAIAEWVIRARPAPRLSVALVLTVATVLIGVGTHYFARFYWGPAILNFALGRAG